MHACILVSMKNLMVFLIFFVFSHHRCWSISAMCEVMCLPNFYFVIFCRTPKLISTSWTKFHQRVLKRVRIALTSTWQASVWVKLQRAFMFLCFGVVCHALYLHMGAKQKQKTFSLEIPVCVGCNGLSRNTLGSPDVFVPYSHHLKYLMSSTGFPQTYKGKHLTYSATVIVELGDYSSPQ